MASLFKHTRLKILVVCVMSLILQGCFLIPPPGPTIPPTPVPTAPPTPPPTPPPAAQPVYLQCFAPEWGAPVGRQTPTTAAIVDAAVQRVIAANPALFEASDSCTRWQLRGFQANSGPLSLWFYQTLAKELGRVAPGVTSLCAWPSGSPGDSKADAIHPASLTPGFAEEYHLIPFGQLDGGKVRCAAQEPGVYLGDWRLGNWPAVAPGSPQPAPSTPPSTLPPSQPPTTPPGGSGACAAPSSAVTEWRTEVHPHGGQQIDVTPVVCGPQIPALIQPGAGAGACGNFCCYLAKEKGTQACLDSLFGQALWSPPADGTPGPGGLKLIETSGPLTVKVAEGAGVATLCGSADPRSCRTVTVAAVVPPCTMVGNSCP